MLHFFTSIPHSIPSVAYTLMKNVASLRCNTLPIPLLLPCLLHISVIISHIYYTVRSRTIPLSSCPSSLMPSNPLLSPTSCSCSQNFLITSINVWISRSFSPSNLFKRRFLSSSTFSLFASDSLRPLYFSSSGKGFAQQYHQQQRH